MQSNAPVLRSLEHVSVQAHLDSCPDPSLTNLTKSTKTIPHKASKFGLDSRECDRFRCFIAARPDIFRSSIWSGKLHWTERYS